MENQTPQKTPESSKPGAELYRLGISQYDRVSSMLLALLIVLGLLVTIMFMIWLTNQIFASTVAAPITMEEVGDQEEDPIGPGDDIEPPPPEETELEQEELDEVIEAVADALATRSALLERSVSGEGDGKGGGGTGRGRKGPPRRWVLRFSEGNTLDKYAKQLDHFQITLGVLRPGNEVEIISNLSKSSPTRVIKSRDEFNKKKIYRFTWTQGSLELADRQLLSRAGISVSRSDMIYKLLTKPMELKLYTMEQNKAGGKKVKTTRFGVREVGSGYEFFILDQSYR